MIMNIVETRIHLGRAIVKRIKIKWRFLFNIIVGAFDPENASFLHQCGKSDCPFLARRIDSSHFQAVDLP